MALITCLNFWSGSWTGCSLSPFQLKYSALFYSSCNEAFFFSSPEDSHWLEEGINLAFTALKFKLGELRLGMKEPENMYMYPKV